MLPRLFLLPIALARTLCSDTLEAAEAEIALLRSGADPSNVSFGSLADLHSPTGYEAQKSHSRQLHRVKPMFFHRPKMTSTYDSAESIATPPLESDLDDEQTCCFHCCTFRREKQVLTDHDFITVSEKTQCQVHLTSEKVQGNLPQCFQTKRKSSQETLSDREGLSSGRQPVQGKGETFFRFCNRKKLRDLFLKNKEIICSQKQNLKSSSKNVKLMLLTSAFVNSPKKKTSSFQSFENG